MRRFMFILFLLFASSSVSFSQVLARFYNKSGIPLNNIRVANIIIGDLDKKQSSDYVNFPYFDFYLGTPDVPIRATIDGNVYENEPLKYMDQNKRIKVSSGTYKLIITFNKRTQKLILVGLGNLCTENHRNCKHRVIK